MLDQRAMAASIGSTAYGTGGEKLGTVEHFLTDDRTGAPTWVALLTGLLGTRTSIVPAVEARVTDRGLLLPVTAAAVRDAPRLDGDHLTPDDEVTLRRHYEAAGAGAPADASTPGPGTPADASTPGPGTPAGASTPGPGTPTGAASADGAMTRSEERLRVGTEQVPATRVRLVKYVVTEEVQVTVPLRREEVRVEELPLDAAAGTAPDPGTASDGEVLVPDVPAGEGLPDVIVLHAERPVVSVEVVPVERVRVRVEQVAGQESITERVQREQIVVDQEGPGR